MSCSPSPASLYCAARHVRRKANACAERRISTIRCECLDRMLIFNERQLVRVLPTRRTTTTRIGRIVHLEQMRPIADIGTSSADCKGVIKRNEILGAPTNEYRHTPEPTSGPGGPTLLNPKAEQPQRHGVDLARCPDVHLLAPRRYQDQSRTISSAKGDSLA
jgi:hypothetical protein